MNHAVLNGLKPGLAAVLCAALLTACPSPTPPTPSAPPPPPSVAPPPPPPPPTTQTILGTALDVLGQPLVNASVLITGKPIVKTDGKGAFSIPDVTTPYDVAVFNASKNEVFVVKGLSETRPTLWQYTGVYTPPASSSFWGQLSGGIGWPTPANVITAVTVFDAVFQMSQSASVSGAFYSGSATPANKAIVRAFQYETNATGLPTNFLGFGETTILNISDPAADRTVTLQPVANAIISGQATAPAGYTVTKNVRVNFPNRGGWTLPTDTSSGTSTLVVPNIPGTILNFRATATKSGGGFVQTVLRGVAPNATGLSLNVPEAPEPLSPSSAATGVDLSTTFTWKSWAGGIQVLHVYPQSGGSAANPSYVIMTNESSVTLPDLSSLGITLPKAKDYVWSVLGDTFYADVNGYVVQSGQPVSPPPIPGLPTLYSFGSSVSRQFTTVP